MTDAITRRTFLAGAAAAGAGALLPGTPGRADPPVLRRVNGSRPFRFVHLADIHVQPERAADRGFAAALRAVEALRPRPDFILTGGDLVFDVMEAGPARARELFALYRRVLADHTALPVRDCLGNHDLFGWRTRAGVTPQTPGYGRALATEFLRLKSTYYHFDHAGWRFFVLDNIQPGGPRGYQGFLDPPQREWLAAELRATGPQTPIVVVEHIPILTVTPFAYEEMVRDRTWRLQNSLVCSDTPERLPLLATRNVRLCLSGHTHQCDRVEYRGTTFVNDGAVSGAWWRGPNRGVEEGFGVFDLAPDGSIRYEYLDYHWEPPRG